MKTAKRIVEEQEIRERFLDECPFWEKLSPRQCEWIINFAISLTNNSEGE